MHFLGRVKWGTGALQSALASPMRASRWTSAFRLRPRVSRYAASSEISRGALAEIEVDEIENLDVFLSSGSRFDRWA